MILSSQQAEARISIACPEDVRAMGQGGGYGKNDSLLIIAKGETQEEARQKVYAFVQALYDKAFRDA